MERTLDPHILAAALGNPRGNVLPTPERLLDIITELEIAAFRSDYSISDEALSTAWLLHGLAALAPDAPGYDPQRIRHALAVSAHVFDLALSDDRHTPTQQLQIAFAAQAGYRRCEQDPNATAVYRKISALVRVGEELYTHIDTLAVEAGCAFLGMDRPALSTALRVWRGQLTALRELLGTTSLAGTMYGPAAAVVEAVHHLHQFLAFGTAEDFETARTLLVSVVEHQAGSTDMPARWVAAHLLDLSGELADSSLYTLLPDGTPPAVARTFALSNPPVLALWPPQRQLLKLEHGNPVDPATSRSLISVPTSAGKTLMAQLVICSHLAQRPGRVLYVSPMRSLGREMRQALRGRLRLLGRRLAAEQPEFPTDVPVHQDLVGDVDIVTPERLMHMIRNNAELALGDIGLIVIDEAHHLAQGRRGFILESLLAFLRASTYDIRLVLLSAAIGNRGALASWLDPSRPPDEVAFTDTWRGPRRMHGLLYPHLLKEQAQRTPRRPSPKKPSTTKATVPVAMRLALRPTAASETALLQTPQLGERSYAASHPGRWNARTRLSGVADYKVFAAGAAALTQAGSVLMVVGTKKEARNTALAIAEHLPQRPQATALTAFLADTLGAEHPLVRCTRKGVAYHHADLPEDVLRAVEDALRADQLLAIASTSTLTDGVNLPVRTVIVHSKVGSDHLSYTDQRRLLPAELLNAVGRAGRAGRESEGWILLTRPYPPAADDFNNLTPDESQLTVTSALLTDEALTELAHAEQQLRDQADALFELASTTTADFASFVWLALVTHSQSPALTGDPLDAVHRLLAMEPAQNPTPAARWLAFAEHIVDTYTRTDLDAARRWSTAGTSLGTARTIDRLARRLAHAFTERTTAPSTGQHPDGSVLAGLTHEWPLGATLDFLAEYDVFEELLQLPEVTGTWLFTDKEIKGDVLAVSLTEAVRNWIAGATIPQLAGAWVPDVPPEWALEQSVRNVSRCLEHALSWTLGALINLTNDSLHIAAHPVRLASQTAWYVRHGVDTPQALALLTSGITSRRLAHLAGRLAQDEGVRTTGLRQWLTAGHIDMWQTRLKATPYEIDELLDYVRTPTSLLGDLLSGRTVSTPLTRIDAAQPADGPISLTYPGSATPTIEAIRDGRRIATVPADHHLDVLAALDSGLELQHVLRRGRLHTTRTAR
ncbi:DEAD/DEAH box helicase [Streptomyces sp. NPDC058373]|uniref:DEAD/DEAH box helicase n=1 Tax=Streptomyces sp. NPDC058373 TaxID=3346465 RepID=UPI0036568390